MSGPTLTPTAEERAERDAVVRLLLDFIARGETVRLPACVPGLDRAGAPSMATVGLEPGQFGGAVGEYRYRFDGEEDLLRLMVVRRDGAELTPAEGRAVAAFVLDAVPPGLVWFRPGRRSMHFFVGHDVLPAHVAPGA
jgi:hypothetical protein